MNTLQMRKSHLWYEFFQNYINIINVNMYQAETVNLLYVHISQQIFLYNGNNNGKFIEITKHFQAFFKHANTLRIGEILIGKVTKVTYRNENAENTMPFLHSCGG